MSLYLFWLCSPRPAFTVTFLCSIFRYFRYKFDDHRLYFILYISSYYKHLKFLVAKSPPKITGHHFEMQNSIRLKLSLPRKWTNPPSLLILAKGLLIANKPRVYYWNFIAVFQVEASIQNPPLCLSCIFFDNMTHLPAGMDCTAANTAIRAKAIKRFFISWLVDV